MREIKDIPLNELIPQRPPFVMIDRLLSSDAVYSVTELEVRNDNIFVEDERLTASGLIENIAQTCAARIGYINLNNGGTVKIGVIGSISNLNVTRTPKVGERLTTTIQLLEEVFNVTMVLASIKIGEEEIVSANMKIALTDIDSKD
ncbi:MAG: pseudouridylate synthase [Bacteroidales bacterium]|jgi:predicted hotdog family 3-hydroxylacyl-ACP dehydratase|nr:pseudouridylate synthase [Bacteroidales bacterium]MBQ2499599.1 pseudouridylate synthase [Bacteroidales bacterium]MBQ7533160.1 pseudouridylate synthase [Bacteroidales bacterium]MCR5035720.1 pseudouridylate synthase [Bacteroidales bacterium]